MIDRGRYVVDFWCDLIVVKLRDNINWENNIKTKIEARVCITKSIDAAYFKAVEEVEEKLKSLKDDRLKKSNKKEDTRCPS